MKITHSIVYKMTGESCVYMLQIESGCSKIEDVVTLIEQQQRKGKIPYGANLLSITCIDVDSDDKSFDKVSG